MYNIRRHGVVNYENSCKMVCRAMSRCHFSLRMVMIFTDSSLEPRSMLI